MADLDGAIAKAIKEGWVPNQPNEPLFARDPGIGMYPPPEPGTTDLAEPGMFCSNDGLVINWMGENFYKSCPERVTGGDSPAEGASYCCKRFDHPNDHEDYDGNTRPVDYFIFYGLSVEAAVAQALEDVGKCYSRSTVDDASMFDQERADKIAKALVAFLMEANP